MNLEELNRKLIAAAKANPPGGQVPYAFEKRVLAHLKSAPAFDEWAWWSRALWRAAAPCLAITLLLSAWTFLTPQPSPQAGDLSQEFQNTLLAAADQDQPTESLW